MPAPKKSDAPDITIQPLREGEMHFFILGTSPLIFNCVSEKAWRELLMPYKKTAADKAGSMKHDPIAEFRRSPYFMRDPLAPTLLALPPIMFKKAMGVAALRTPGARKTEIEQLVRVDWDYMPIFGTPKIFCAIVRSADMNRTPDVRTRAMLPEWGCKLTVRFEMPILREQVIADLLSAAGRVSGVGDWRQEKGSGAFGSFRLASVDDPAFERVMAQGREVQENALDHPEPYDEETHKVMSWFLAEAPKRGFQATGGAAPIAQPKPEPKAKRVPKEANGDGAHLSA